MKKSFLAKQESIRPIVWHLRSRVFTGPSQSRQKGMGCLSVPVSPMRGVAELMGVAFSLNDLRRAFASLEMKRRPCAGYFRGAQDKAKE